MIDPTDDPESEIFEGEVLGSTNGLTLADWCAMIRRNARITCRDRVCRVGGRVYPVEEIAPLAMLHARLGLDVGAVWHVLNDRPELLRALG